MRKEKYLGRRRNMKNRNAARTGFGPWELLLSPALIYSNYFFAILIILSGSLLWFYSKKSPELVNYELTSKGFQVKSHLYPYENIKSFYVQVDHTPTLFIKTERFYMPILSIPIEYNLADDIYNIFMSKNVMEEEMKEHPSEKIIRSLGL